MPAKVAMDKATAAVLVFLTIEAPFAAVINASFCGLALVALGLWPGFVFMENTNLRKTAPAATFKAAGF
jgi:hypothetical protein